MCVGCKIWNIPVTERIRFYVMGSFFHNKVETKGIQQNLIKKDLLFI